MRNRPVLQLSESEIALARSLVLHEDRSLLALNKLAGLACEVRGGRNVQTLNRLLAAFARSNGKRPHLAHRLDAETSGVILAAQTKPAAAALQTAFETRQMAKTYLAIATGRLPESDSGRIDRPIRRVRRRGAVVAEACAHDDEDARPAVTDWCLLARAGDAALLRLSPVTGRMHQIRIHLATIGLVIAGETRHGTGAPAPRLMLHARAIAGPHPDGGRFSCCAVPPPDFVKQAEVRGLAAGLKDAY